MASSIDIVFHAAFGWATQSIWRKSVSRGDAEHTVETYPVTVPPKLSSISSKSSLTLRRNVLNFQDNRPQLSGRSSSTFRTSVLNLWTNVLNLWRNVLNFDDDRPQYSVNFTQHEGTHPQRSRSSSTLGKPKQAGDGCGTRTADTIDDARMSSQNDACACFGRVPRPPAAPPSRIDSVPFARIAMMAVLLPLPTPHPPK